MVLIDTTVISEMFKPMPDGRVVAWLEATPRSDLHLCSVVVAELQLRVALMPAGRRRDQLAAMISTFVAASGEILPFEGAEAIAYARIRAHRQSTGKPLKVVDAQIAAIAATRGFAVATRNVRDFDDCGIKVVNPWEFNAK